MDLSKYDPRQEAAEEHADATLAGARDFIRTVLTCAMDSYEKFTGFEIEKSGFQTLKESLEDIVYSVVRDAQEAANCYEGLGDIQIDRSKKQQTSIRKIEDAIIRMGEKLPPCNRRALYPTRLAEAAND